MEVFGFRRMLGRIEVIFFIRKTVLPRGGNQPKKVKSSAEVQNNQRCSSQPKTNLYEKELALAEL